MLKRATPRPWTCARCVRQQQRKTSSRWLTTSTTHNGAASAAAATHANSSQPVQRGSPSANHDDRTLRQIFDSPDFWKDFSGKAQQYYGGKSAGLFQNRY